MHCGTHFFFQLFFIQCFSALMKPFLFLFNLVWISRHLSEQLALCSETHRNKKCLFTSIIIIYIYISTCTQAHTHTHTHTHRCAHTCV
uniref:Uncharacterized protein n=1 Tax=Anguilla anguilla TaxID=7936 RepID=A0A0E9W690_ANGAN